MRGLRAAINSAIRQKLVRRVDAQRIARMELAGKEVEERTNPDGDGEREGHVEGDGSVAPVIERRDEARTFDGNQDVLVLQFEGKDAGYQTRSLVNMVLGAALSTLKNLRATTSGWTFYLGLDRPHVEGLTAWLGVSMSVPPSFADLIQGLLEGMKHRVRREMGVVCRHELQPIAFVCPEGVELPTGPDAPGKADLDMFEVPRIIRRPFVLSTARAMSTMDLEMFLLGRDPT
jgi:hypothetical protein